jgi:hypothetical protein
VAAPLADVGTMVRTALRWLVFVGIVAHWLVQRCAALADVGTMVRTALRWLVLVQWHIGMCSAALHWLMLVQWYVQRCAGDVGTLGITLLDFGHSRCTAMEGMQAWQSPLLLSLDP